LLVDVADSDKRSNLLRYNINYSREIFIVLALEVVFTSLTFRVEHFKVSHLVKFQPYQQILGKDSNACLALTYKTFKTVIYECL
jgi:hypothetical protein